MVENLHVDTARKVLATHGPSPLSADAQTVPGARAPVGRVSAPLSR